MGSIQDSVTNGHSQPPDSEEGGTYGFDAPNGIPPASARANPAYVEQITIPLNNVPAFTPRRKLRVVTIGAGYSGLTLAHRLQHIYNKEMDQLIDHVIYEAKDQPGGTWVANTYPGVQCDVPSCIYAFPFDPNPNWSHFYSVGSEILEYIQKTVKKWNLDKHVVYNTRVTGCYWQEDRSQWKLTIEHDGETREEYSDVVISARGFLSHWHWPKIDGLETFKGKRVHSAGWDHDFDYSHKRIAVIGNGSSGIQILPQMAKLEGTDVTSFQRGPTWVFSRMTPAQLVGSDDPSFNPEYRQQDKEKFQDPEELKKYRKVVQGGINSAFHMFVKDSEQNKSSTEFAINQMSAKLNHDPELCEKLIPKWELGCRRVTPGDGYLESFLLPNVHLTNSSIVKVDETGIVTEDGKHHDLDVIVCATGFDISHVPPYPVVGRGGVTLTEKWKDEPESYLSLACPDMPNYFLFTGPNATVGHGSLIQSLVWTSEWVIKWLRKMAREDIASVVPKQEVVDEFVRYGDQIHKTLTWTGGCRSWYKANRVDGRVTATFAGSAILFHTLLSEIRGEDFDIRYRSRNRFRFLGNGFTPFELQEGADLAFYVTT
ncbi:FAD/NAD(P)-binding domain-containing protein [Rhizodiscina lignyota]|uniref:FAD/NAD(P)-binding domain-containing protein n=1 Tax=Rhizodiscina lignyota TaxID=1504668 RepID=A0A9P4M2A0_9PEZI|nr:FAD/NAD(P)-binding domain-containing protein [Rhizodiscina lignyota]